MAKIAVDAVLLPSDEMMDRAIEANRELLKQCADKIVLDKENCLPHISLAMGCIDEKDIVDIEKVLLTITKQYSLEQLSIIDIHIETNSAGEKVSVFRIERTKTLQFLHEEIMQRLAPYFSHDVTADMILSPPEAGESTLLWIKSYPEKSSFENFFPHITIGYGDIGGYSFGSAAGCPLDRGVRYFPIRFTASKLALCHLGNHCTCKKILASAEL